MSSNDSLRRQLDLLAVAEDVRCLTGRQDCICGGCRAHEALKHADQLIAEDKLLDAHEQLFRASGLYVSRVLDRLGDELWVAMHRVPSVEVA